jgi:hypothetical protein
MRRPRHLPEKFWLPVEAIWAKGTAALLLAKPSSFAMKRKLSIGLVIKPVVITLAESLCKAGRAGVYSIERMHCDLDELRWALSVELCPGPRKQSDCAKSFDREARNAIVNSHEWRAHLAERAAVAEELLVKRQIASPRASIASAANPVVDARAIEDSTMAFDAGVRDQPVSVAPTPRATVEGDCIFRQTSTGWEIAFAGSRRTGLTDLKGFTLIRTLLDNPGRQISSVALVSGELGAYAIGFKGLDAIDAGAKRAYKHQLQQLSHDQDEALRRQDFARAAALEAEEDALQEQLKRDLGLGGRPRTVGSDLERARKTASARFNRALQRIRKLVPALAEHLKAAVHCGHDFMYSADQYTRWVTR